MKLDRLEVYRGTADFRFQGRDELPDDDGEGPAVHDHGVEGQQ